MTRTPTMRGGVLVLIILIMISLSVFSVLAWVSARSDLNMAEKNALWIRQYYELDLLGAGTLREARRHLASGAPIDALESLGWTVYGDRAGIELAKSSDESDPDARVQRLRIEVAAEDGGLRVTEWLQKQDPLPDDGDGRENIIIFN